ncbi:MAG: phosphoribosylglycinamide formyltransferase [Rhizobiales bacterium]|nr:phosphoribosylglycinamide formyltransferase [Hyphomicrobiales bacterium]
MIERKRVAILISGRGSNMKALVGASKNPIYPAEIALVLSNRVSAAGLAFAEATGIQTSVIDHKKYGTRESFDTAIDARLREAKIELVALAGFMRIMTAGFVDAWRDRMINIHPSLLPSYKGLHTHERALADGVKIHGCTSHFVRHDVDAGPIIAQAAVPVLEGDTPETLSARVLLAEHQLYPHALRLVASGRARVENERVVIADSREATAPLINPPLR